MRRVLAIISIAVAACGPTASREANAAPAANHGRAELRRAARGKPHNCEAVLAPIVTSTLSSRGVPGAIVSVSVPGECDWTATFGTGNVATGEPMRLPDHLRVGSITKTFTGTAVLQLVDEERIGLDDPVSEYLSGVPGGDRITVRQLLNMTSRLYNYSEDLGFNESLDAAPDRVWSIDALLAIAFSHDPYPEPGFHYSNTNSVLLGRLVEKVTGHSLAEELEDRIFGPLHMNATSLPALEDASLPPPYARGYMYGTNVGTLPPACDAADAVAPHDVTHASPSWTWAAGGAISNLRDLTNWARALALGTLLTPRTQAERLQWVDTGPPPAPRYGLHITNFAGVIGHDGALPGYQSFMGYVPSKDATLIVLTNVDPDRACARDGPADAIAKLIAAELGLLGQ